MTPTLIHPHAEYRIDHGPVRRLPMFIPPAPVAEPPPAEATATSMDWDDVEYTDDGGSAAGIFDHPPRPGQLRVLIGVDIYARWQVVFATKEQMLGWLYKSLTVVKAVYERDIGVSLQVRFIQIWQAEQPWQNAPELRLVWETDPRLRRVRRALVIGINPSQPYGGKAFQIHALCNDNAYAIAGANAAATYFDDEALTAEDRDGAWSIAHEIGHLFGAVHDDCAQPPIDYAPSRCYVGEPVCPHGGGSIMSYARYVPCVTLPSDPLSFNRRTIADMRATAEGAACLRVVGDDCRDGMDVDNDGLGGDCDSEPLRWNPLQQEQEYGE